MNNTFFKSIFSTNFDAYNLYSTIGRLSIIKKNYCYLQPLTL